LESFASDLPSRGFSNQRQIENAQNIVLYYEFTQENQINLRNTPVALSVLSSSSSRARTTGRILASGGAAEVGGIRNGVGLGGARKGRKRIVREVQRGSGLPEEWRRMADVDWEGAAQGRKERRVGYGEGTRENLGRLQAVGTTAVAFRDGEPCNFQRRRPATPNPPPAVPPACRGQGQTRRV